MILTSALLLGEKIALPKGKRRRHYLSDAKPASARQNKAPQGRPYTVFLCSLIVKNQGKTMKLTTAAMILSALFPAAALATGDNGNHNGPRNGGNSAGNAAAISGASSKSEARAASAAMASSKSKSSATGGNASAQGGTATASNGGNTVTINGQPGDGRQATHYSGGYEIKNTPDVFAPTALTTSPCRNGVSGGIAGSGFGLSFGGSGRDVACDLRQLAILYNGLGQKEKAVQVADGALALECGDSDTAKALGNLCPEKPREEKPAAAVALF